MSEEREDATGQDQGSEQVNASAAERAASAAAEPTREPDAGAAGGGVAEAIEAWWNEHIHGSIVARNTEVLNYLRKAVEALKARLAGRDAP